MSSLRVVAARWGLPLVMVLQGFLGFLGLLDAFGVVFYPTVYRATVVRRFELGFSLVVPLALLLVLPLMFI